MGLFPKVESPCPYKYKLDDIMQDDFCNMCERNVFDLTHMSETERKVFLSGCSGEICVSYRLPVRKIVAGAALAAATMPGLAAAQDASDATIENDDLYCYSEEDWIIVGGIRDVDEALWIDPETEKHLTDIPESMEFVDDKKQALMLFALNGLEDADSDEADEDMQTASLIFKEE